MTETTKRGRGRPPRETTELQNALLEDVAHNAEQRRIYESAYIDSIMQARECGATLRAIAQAAGVSDESIRLTVKNRIG